MQSAFSHWKFEWNISLGGRPTSMYLKAWSTVCPRINLAKCLSERCANILTQNPLIFYSLAPRGCKQYNRLFEDPPVPTSSWSPPCKSILKVKIRFHIFRLPTLLQSNMFNLLINFIYVFVKLSNWEGSFGEQILYYSVSCEDSCQCQDD